MKKIGFISGITSFLLGCVTLIVASIIKEVMPKYGYAQFQSAAAGSYTEESYLLDFAFANTVAILLIVAGLIFAAYCFFSHIFIDSKRS